MKFEESDALYQDPFHFLDLALAAGSQSMEFPGRSLYLASVEDAKVVLANKENWYSEHSDFFNTRHGYFGPRTRQIDISRAAIKLLHGHYVKQKNNLRVLVHNLAGKSSAWPDSGNVLVYQFFKEALICDPLKSRTHHFMDAIVQRSVLSGARAKYSFLQRTIFRFKALRAFKAEIQARRKHPRPERDVLDAIIQQCDVSVTASDITEIFLSFLFAISGSVGFALSWSLYLQGNADRRDIENKEWIVLEALRLWPVAWNLARQPKIAHTLPSGLEVTTDDMIIACPYASQRNPAEWHNAAEFKPERWQDADLRRSLIAFGWGEHKCVAANLSLQIVTEVLSLLDAFDLEYHITTERPMAQPALAPPTFNVAISIKSADGISDVA